MRRLSSAAVVAGNPQSLPQRSQQRRRCLIALLLLLLVVQQLNKAIPATPTANPTANPTATKGVQTEMAAERKGVSGKRERDTGEEGGTATRRRR